MGYTRLKLAHKKLMKRCEPSKPDLGTPVKDVKPGGKGLQWEDKI